MSAPLSYTQERLWFLHQLDPASTRYNVPTALRFTGPLDPGALQRALTDIMTRHEVLRTVFADPGGVPEQRVLPPTACPLPVTDISTSRTPMMDAERLVAQAASMPFDLTAGPLLRARLIRLSENEHILALTLHHIVSDEWSTRVLGAEISAVYAAYRSGCGSPLPAPAMQYADFAAQQRAQLTGERAEELLAYWRGRLAGLDPVRLPTDRPRGAAAGRAGAVLEFDIPAGISEQLQQTGRRSGCTLFMVLLAAYQAVLARHCGTTDVAVGTTITHRAASAESLIGCFLNTLVLRTDLSGDPTFAELLARVRETALGAFEHQDLPFERLVDELAPVRDLNRPPLFQVAFSYYENRQGSGPALADTRYCSFPTPPTPARFDATLTATYTPAEGVHAAVEYDPALFDQVTIESLTDHLTALLTAAADDPGQPISQLPFLTDRERAAVMRWSGHGAAFSAGTVPERIDRRAAEQPDDIAIVAGDVTISYAEMIDRAEQLAGRLCRLGARPETVIGLCLPPGADLVTGILGIWRAGCAYLPIDPDCPRQRAAWMLRDAGVSLLITTAGNGQVAPGLTAIAPRGAVTEGTPARPPTDACYPPHPAQLAYVIYTSGSTGQPKGVAVQHDGLANLAEAHRREFGVSRADRVLQFAAAGFDASVFDLVGALNAGATAVFADQDARRDPVMLAELIDTNCVTMATLPPALLGALDPAALGSVRLLVSAGDRLPAAAARRWSRGRRLVNAYGPTEATVWATAASVPETVSADPPIGGPIANVHCHVVDTAGQLAPIGAPGELLIGGPGVSRGYLGRPALTAERFTADAITGNGGRLYRTGDRARWRRDGTLEFLGRLDDQISARGWRIEPGEVEAALISHPAVRMAAVDARPAADGEPQLIAWLIAEGPEPPSARDLRRHLAQQLPAAAVPAVFVPVHELPLTAAGKVNRRALPAPVRHATEPPAGQPPRTPAENALAAIWAELLGRPAARTDSFFELGGHSLLVARMVNRARHALGVSLSIRDVFDTPVLADLAARLDALGPSDSEPIGRADRDRRLPLSFAQQRLWFLQQLDPASTEYLICFALRLTGHLDQQALTKALEELVARHEPLRTTFAATAGVPEQVIHPPGPLPLPVADLSEADDPPAQAMAELEREARTPADLADGPVFRPLLLKVADEDHVLSLVMHHVVGDEWSTRVLTHDLLSLYEAARAGRPSPLPPLPIQYADFAAWQRQRLTGDRLNSQLSYWRNRLAGLRPLELPTDRPHPAARDPAAAWLEFDVPGEVTSSLVTLARTHQVTMFMIVLAALQVVLAQYSGHDDVAVGTPVAGRDRLDTEPLIGLFLNTVVLRTDLSGNPSFADLLSRVRETTLGAYAHQDLPFEQLVDEITVRRDRGRHPLVQVVLNYSITEAAADGPAARTGLAAQEFSPPSDTAKFDLRLVVEDDGTTLHAGLQYRRDLFDPGTAEQIASHLCATLTAAAEDPGQKARLLPPAPQAGAAQPPAAGPLLASMVGLHAMSWPDLPAATDPDTTLTYAQLDCRAAEIASRLAALQVGPETVVALALPHSVDLLAAIAGVWRAGAAFVALDPEDPLGRLQHKVLDARAAAIVTTQGVAGELPDLHLPTVMVDGEDGPRGHPVPPTTLHPDQMAYIIYTSGSTGEPKQIGITHRNLAVYAYAVVAALHPSPQATWSLPLSLSADLSLTALAAALVTAGCVCLTEPAITRDPQAFVRALAASRPDYLKITPTHLRMLLSVPGHAAALPRRGLILGGEPTPPPLLAALAASGWDGTLYNHYGPAETTIGVLTHCAADRRRFPLGTPLAGADCHVVDEHGQPVAVGVLGELCVGGPTVGRGYLGRPDLTAERFIADPRLGAGARLYRTGDLVRRGADGVLHFAGRRDGQINLHGHRIEPREIEKALNRHPQVAAAVADVRPDPTGGDRLAAWFVPRQADEIPDPGQLRAFLARSLPAAMIPAVFAPVGELPLTASGKVNRHALPDPAAAIVPRGATPLVTPTEMALAGLWAPLLGIGDIGGSDDFFDLGGHSLLATQLTAQVRAELGVELPLTAIFDHPALSALAAVIDTLGWISAGAPAEGAGPGTEVEEMDL